MRHRLFGAVSILCLSLLLSGCWPFRKKPLPPPPAQPSIGNTETPVGAVQVPDKVPVPEMEIPQPAPEPQFPQQTKEQEEPPQRTPGRPPSPPKGSAKKPTASAPAETQPPTPQTPPAGKLGEILTDEQKSEYRRVFQQSDSAARRSIESITRRQLNAEQQDVLSRIRSFLQQASEAAENDWPLAAQLARRAELLAKDLEAGLR